MIDLESIFRFKKMNKDKLLRCGFRDNGVVYRRETPIMGGQFLVDVSINRDGTAGFRVIETELGEEYNLVNVSDAQGGFVGDVREACEKVLLDVADKCFDTQTLEAEQTKRVMKYIHSRFAIEPEFLWAQYPGYAVFRRPDNKKWLAIIMTVDKSKLGLTGHGNIEIIDLKAVPEIVEALLKRPCCYPAYHMNKNHWFTVCLDGSLSDEEMFSLIDSSRSGAGNKKK